MAVKKGGSESLRKGALEILGKQLAGKNLEIVGEDTDTVPSSKETVYRFVARPADEPNGPHATVVLDAAGKTVDLAKLAEGRGLFAPSAEAVELPAALLARRVTTDPRVDDFQLGECGFREKITVDIPPQPITQPVDVYFLADNTGSMGPAIASVQAGAASILATLAGTGLDIQYGVGNYHDFGDPVPAFQNQLSITGNQPAVLAAINLGWSANFGGDTPEANLYALHEVATGFPPGNPPIGWRPAALKFIVWFGDAPGHETVCPAVWGGGFDIDRHSVIGDLNTAQPGGIDVLAISVSSGPGLDAATSGYPGCTNVTAPGQATDIVNGAGGSVTSGVNPGATAAAILAALVKAVQIKDVHLQPTGAIASFVTSITPPSYGPLDPTKPHQLTFDVVFERGFERCSLRDQVFTGTIDVVMDGAVVARKPTKITIPKCRYHYVVKFVCGVNEQSAEGCSPLRPGRYATEINIYNGHCAEAAIEKRVTPVVLRGEPIGREPRIGKEMAVDRIQLPPRTATMDDCCRLAELLKQPVTLNGPLTIGFLEIVSSVPLTVTAVYTASGLKDDAVSLEVEQIVEIRK